MDSGWTGWHIVVEQDDTACEGTCKRRVFEDQHVPTNYEPGDDSEG